MVHLEFVPRTFDVSDKAVILPASHYVLAGTACLKPVALFARDGAVGFASAWRRRAQQHGRLLTRRSLAQKRAACQKVLLDGC
ncbi:hypothetical protein [Paraburkholderia xenovorans]|uniref:hypothetical protein n=1 Tax=Paraburkholderia xenovorans TaxID=36873 RepID=UPI0038BB41A5